MNVEGGELTDEQEAERLALEAEAGWEEYDRERFHKVMYGVDTDIGGDDRGHLRLDTGQSRDWHLRPVMASFLVIASVGITMFLIGRNNPASNTRTGPVVSMPEAVGPIVLHGFIPTKEAALFFADAEVVCGTRSDGKPVLWTGERWESVSYKSRLVGIRYADGSSVRALVRHLDMGVWVTERFGKAPAILSRGAVAWFVVPSRALLDDSPYYSDGTVESDDILEEIVARNIDYDNRDAAIGGLAYRAEAFCQREDTVAGWNGLPLKDDPWLAQFLGARIKQTSVVSSSPDEKFLVQLQSVRGTYPLRDDDLAVIRDKANLAQITLVTFVGMRGSCPELRARTGAEFPDVPRLVGDMGHVCMYEVSRSERWYVSALEAHGPISEWAGVYFTWNMDSNILQRITLIPARTLRAVAYERPSDELASRWRNDADGDHVPNILERALGTNPNAKDTDGDGLDDGEEIGKLWTDPLLKDTDGDGLLDSKEIPSGHQPLFRDNLEASVAAEAHVCPNYVSVYGYDVVVKGSVRNSFGSRDPNLHFKENNQASERELIRRGVLFFSRREPFERNQSQLYCVAGASHCTYGVHAPPADDIVVPEGLGYVAEIPFSHAAAWDVGRLGPLRRPDSAASAADYTQITEHPAGTFPLMWYESTPVNDTPRRRLVLVENTDVDHSLRLEGFEPALLIGYAWPPHCPTK